MKKGLVNMYGILMLDQWNYLHTQKWHQPYYPHDRIVAWTFRNFPKNQAAQLSLLDSGCGTGRHALFWAREGYNSFACDFAQSGVDITCQRAQAEGLEIQCKVCSSEALDYPDNHFDGLLSFGVFYYLPAVKKTDFFDEIFRVLKPGGKALVVLRSTDDERCKKAMFQGNSAYLLQDGGEFAPSDAEFGMEMLFLNRCEIALLSTKFSKTIIDSMVFTEMDGNFTNSDWYIQLEK